MLIETLTTNPIYYASVVVVVLISIVLHELGHAYAALWEGDTTPRDLGHLDLNPLTHMSGIAIIALLLVGISWGQCPVDPRRFRHRKYGDAIVAFAGPATNLILMLAFTFAVTLWSLIDFQSSFNPDFPNNVAVFLQLGAIMNAALFLLNMLPLAPLDGFTVARSMIPAFRNIASVLEEHAMLMLLLVLAFGSGPLFDTARIMVDGVLHSFSTVALLLF